ncbi:bifunctional ADP-dependent NAD(P)H-hydrate dehydratase/NAD(P)H-hydrate epimerase [Streptomyces sp. NBC_01429]|uniref:bifunctional ADP-dependent NAD(P)H-hydrate dehydratase/NAD(P)H-hydrate epimerase n=1 Tax=Streptomyces sp. NBC_01429 TaxID=2903862 RepID=UPI002E2D1B1C|nr:NAD(P)H-hydrate dehydratase [Streptomyces sp. NBC_01429]
MRTAHSVEAVRNAERELMARLPEGTLMRRAAASLATACAGLLKDLLGRVYGARVVLLVGSGDNGGDALYAGARLARRGAGVCVVPLAPGRTHPGGLAALLGAGGRIAEDPFEVLATADLVLDGITGIGGHGGLRPDAVPVVRAARGGSAMVVAVDLPSGVEADSGEVTGEAVRADATVTFGTYKPGLLIDPARERAGALRLVDIGLGPYLPSVPALEALQHADVARLLPRPVGESDKYRRGVIGVVAGSARYPGAAVLAVSGALRGGAGAVRYVGPGGEAVLARFPETLVHEGPPSKAGRVQAWVVGPGLGDGSWAAAAVADVLASDVPVLVDADGLRLLDARAVRDRAAPTLLTPHAGEAAALLGVPREEVEAGRLAAVRELAARYGATVLLKGSTTLVADPGRGDRGGADPGGADVPGSGTGSGTGSAPLVDSAHPVRVNPTGTPWLATAGSGDVLSGLAGSLLATGLPARDAASVAAYLHGLSARLASRGAPVAADDVAAWLPEAWRNVVG